MEEKDINDLIDTKLNANIDKAMKGLDIDNKIKSYIDSYMPKAYEEIKKALSSESTKEEEEFNEEELIMY